MRAKSKSLSLVATLPLAATLVFGGCKSSTPAAPPAESADNSAAQPSATQPAAAPPTPAPAPSHATGCSSHTGPCARGCAGSSSSGDSSGTGTSSGPTAASSSEAFDGSERNDDTGHDYAATEREKYITWAMDSLGSWRGR